MSQNRLIRPTCPKLCSITDAETAHLYPTQENRCCLDAEFKKIAYGHQEVFCLTDQYIKCSVFNQKDSSQALLSNNVIDEVGEDSNKQEALSVYDKKINIESERSWVPIATLLGLFIVAIIVVGIFFLFLSESEEGTSSDGQLLPTNTSSPIEISPTLLPSLTPTIVITISPSNIPNTIAPSQEDPSVAPSITHTPSFEPSWTPSIPPTLIRATTIAESITTESIISTNTPISPSIVTMAATITYTASPTYTATPTASLTITASPTLTITMTPSLTLIPPVSPTFSSQISNRPQPASGDQVKALRSQISADWGVIFQPEELWQPTTTQDIILINNDLNAIQATFEAVAIYLHYFLRIQVEISPSDYFKQIFTNIAFERVNTSNSPTGISSNALDNGLFIIQYTPNSLANPFYLSRELGNIIDLKLNGESSQNFRSVLGGNEGDNQWIPGEGYIGFETYFPYGSLSNMDDFKDTLGQMLLGKLSLDVSPIRYQFLLDSLPTWIQQIHQN